MEPLIISEQLLWIASIFISFISLLIGAISIQIALTIRGHIGNFEASNKPKSNNSNLDIESKNPKQLLIDGKEIKNVRNN